MAIPYSRTIAGLLPWYSVLIVTGILLAIGLASKEERRLGLPKDCTIDLALVVVPCGIIGARAYYVAMSWQSFAAQPLSVLYIWQGGLAIYGGVIGGALGAWIYARCKKISFPAVADMIAPGLLLAQAVGRWGNYFNMEAYGPALTDGRLQFFPLAVLVPEDGAYVWHAATFFYESMWNLGGCIALWRLRKKQRERGNVFAWYLVIYGSGRFVIEQLRQDSLMIGSLRASQLLSLALCAAGAAVLLYRCARGSRMRLMLSALCMALWLAQWLAQWGCVEAHGAYGLLMLSCVLLGVRLLGKNHGARRWLAAALLVDAAGIFMAVSGWPLSQAVALYLHGLLCSLSVPMGLRALTDAQED